MASRFKPLIHAFGLADGIRFYIHLLFKKYGSFSSSLYKAVFHLRKNFSDKYTFTQVFLDDQYNVVLPFIPKTIIDGGANIGLASAYFAHRYPGAAIVAVEPGGGNYAMALKNTASFPQIKTYQKGIWSKTVHLAIINKGDHDNAFIVEETTADNPDAIPAVSIESIMREQGWATIDILKLDIEGSEKEVFESGYEYWLPRTRAVIIEIHDHMRKGAGHAVFKAITQYHFSFSMQHENLIFINEEML
ncbi:MAG: FkbM family methyltransferase [Chitinophagaceae bacterium]|nr:FkbM family methyltransferase [Chitinophagaceae bacterium]MDP1762993.1 FkbM family methyltransferase [Sediminibacterium sp.]MDP1811825.1 FkbM family methyltransferase [Sediminibacterium sp.]MDP3127644.1 FkbM family methyltransferase [Sediminibacterium sp.]MDP3666807.1 FkbM family methyltransferase [Sediminibacterium sp.]